MCVCVCNEARTLPRSLPDGDVVAPRSASFCCRSNSSSLCSLPPRCSRLTVSPLTHALFPLPSFSVHVLPFSFPLSLSLPLVLLQLISSLPILLSALSSLFPSIFFCSFVYLTVLHLFLFLFFCHLAFIFLFIPSLFFSSLSSPSLFPLLSSSFLSFPFFSNLVLTLLFLYLYLHPFYFLSFPFPLFSCPLLSHHFLLSSCPIICKPSHARRSYGRLAGLFSVPGGRYILARMCLNCCSVGHRSAFSVCERRPPFVTPFYHLSDLCQRFVYFSRAPRLIGDQSLRVPSR